MVFWRKKFCDHFLSVFRAFKIRKFVYIRNHKLFPKTKKVSPWQTELVRKFKSNFLKITYHLAKIVFFRFLGLVWHIEICCHLTYTGVMAEWSKAQALKSLQGLASSNLTGVNSFYCVLLTNASLNTEDFPWIPCWNVHIFVSIV